MPDLPAGAHWCASCLERYPNNPRPIWHGDQCGSCAPENGQRWDENRPRTAAGVPVILVDAPDPQEAP